MQCSLVKSQQNYCPCTLSRPALTICTLTSYITAKIPLKKKKYEKKYMINSLMLILKKKKKLPSSKPLNDKLVTVPKA